MTAAQDKRGEFRKALEHFDDAMLVTRSADGALRARPMAVAESQADGDVWFVTYIDSPKVDEIRVDDRIGVTMQGEGRYLSISGTGEIVRDRAKVHELWKEQWKVWFPNGKDDPNIALIRVRAEEAEYWDQHGTKGLKYLLEAVKALARGTTPNTKEIEQHGKVRN